MSAIFTVMVSLSGSNFEMMSRKTGASALIAHSDSSLRSARRSYFSSWILAPPWCWGEDGFRADDAADITYRRERQAFSGRR